MRLMSENIDWASLALGELHQSRVRTLCERMLGGEGDHVEAAILYVIDELSRDDWRKCRKFQGKSRPETWLYSLTVNLIREYRQKHISGKKRPPVWIQEKSDPLWEKAWRGLMVQRQTPLEIIHELSTGTGRDETEVRELLRLIQQREYQGGRRRQGQSGSERIRLLYAANNEASEISLEQLADDHDDDWRRRAYEELLLWLDRWLGGDAEDGMQALDGDALARAREKLSLTDEAQLILRLHFVEGRSWQAIARSLRLPGHQPARIAQRACRDIGDALAEAGVDLADLLSGDEDAD